MILYLSDGTESLEFQTDQRGVTAYRPAAPDGRASVTETVELFVSPDDALRPQGVATAAERLLSQAARRWGASRARPQRPAVTPVYLYLRAFDGDELWRAEVFGGRIEWGALALHAAFLPSHTGELAVILERTPWWEGEERALPIKTASAARTTSAQTLDNVGNYLQVEAVDVAGNLPALLRPEIYNASGVGISIETLLMGVGSWYDVDGPQLLYEGESAAGLTAGGAASSGYSNSDYGSGSLASATASEIAVWSLSAATLNAAAGARFRVLARVASATQDCQIQARIATTGVNGITLWAGPLTTIDASAIVELVDLGVTELPPGGAGQSSLGALNLEMWGRHLGTSSTVGIDYFFLLPVDSYRRASIVKTLKGSVDTLVIDEPGRKAYVRNDSDATYGGVVLDGAPLTIPPGRTSRFYILGMDDGDVALASYGFEVQVFYRPRRSSL